MTGHLLGVLKPSVVLQVDRDTGRPPSVTSDRGEKARRFGPLPDRSPGVVAVQSTSRHLHSSRIYALKQRLSALKAGGSEYLEDLLEQVMYGHIILLAAFFMESQPPTGTVMIVIINFEFQYGAHTDQGFHNDLENDTSH